MQSGRSFFNSAIYKKTLLRCWPLWLIYIGVWVAQLPMGMIYDLERERWLMVQHHVLHAACQAGAYFSFFACAAVAMAVFGWMYNIKNVSFAASLPVSRSTHYLTSVAAGLTVLLGSNVVVFLITAVTELLYGGLDLATLFQWLAWVSLLNIHFFGFAACCAMLTGHLLILPAVYAIFQLAAVTIQGTMAYILEHIVWGLDYGQWSMGVLSPIWNLASIYPGAAADPVTYETQSYHLAWAPALCYAGAGVLLAVLGWWLFRRRKMETATDVVAISVLKPVFRWCLAFAGSLGFGGLLVALVYTRQSGGGDLTDALIILLAMVLGGLIGWFLSDILMRKTVRVFHLHWKGAVLYTAIVALLVLGAELDLTGYEKKLPPRENVERVYVSCSEGWVELEEPENIDRVLALNESLIANRNIHEQTPPENGWYTFLYLSYDGAADESGFRKNLRSRHYEILITDELAADPDSDVSRLEDIINSKEAIRERKATQVPVTPETISYACIANDYSYDEDMFSLTLTSEEAYELYTQCILPDMAEGTLGRVWIAADEDYEKTVYNLRIQMELQQARPDWDAADYEEPIREGPPSAEAVKEIPYEYDYFYTTPTVDSRRTNAWLTDHGVPLETLWEMYDRAK